MAIIIAPCYRFLAAVEALLPVREHQNIKNLDDLVGPLTIAPISTVHEIINNPRTFI